MPNLRDAKKLCINSSLALVGGGFQGFFADHASLQGLGEDDGEDEDALDEDKDEDDNA